MKSACQQFLVACMLLSRFPVSRYLQANGASHGLKRPFPHAQTDAAALDLPPLSDTIWAWPLIGGFIGLITSVIVLALLLFHVPLPLAIFWAVAFQLCCTGALHEDGLMDSFDGLPGGATVDRRLEIMRDSRVGSYGALAGICAILGKFAAYIEIFVTFSNNPAQLVLSIAAAAAFGRLGMIWVIVQSRPARTDGMASQLCFSWERTLKPLLASMVFSALVGVDATVAAIISTALIAWGVRRYSESRINGYTGDVLGAACVITELAVLTCFCAIGRGIAGLP